VIQRRYSADRTIAGVDLGVRRAEAVLGFFPSDGHLNLSFSWALNSRQLHHQTGAAECDIPCKYQTPYLSIRPSPPSHINPQIPRPFYSMCVVCPLHLVFQAPVFQVNDEAAILTLHASCYLLSHKAHFLCSI
jgi:hypothetical protein